MNNKKLKILTALLLGVFSHTSFANQSPFPYAPLHLQSEVKVISSGGAKPNVLLYIDDSGSMVACPDGSYPCSGPSRLDVTKKVLSDIVKRYQDDMRWAVYTINGLGRQFPFPKTYEDKDNWINAINFINKIQLNGLTPSTAGYMRFTPDLLSSFQYRCQKSYVIFMSDGDAYSGNLKHHEMNIPTYFTSYGTYITYPLSTAKVKIPGDNNMMSANNLGRYTRDILTYRDIKVGGTDAAGQSWDDTAFPPQTVTTYTIGFGTGISYYGRNYLTKTASTDDKFIMAEDSQKLTDAFDQIFNSVSEDNQVGKIEAYSVAAPAVSTNSIDGLAASATLDTGSWASQLRFYKIDPTTNMVNTKVWNNAEFPSKRNILTSANGNYQLLENLQLNNEFFGISNANSSGKNEWKEALLPWLTRSKTDAIIEQYGKSVRSDIPYRVRLDKDRQIGDIIDNPILAFGDANPLNKRAEYLVTSANDGMLYIFKNTQNATDSNASPYRLAFNYLPMSMQRHSIDDQETVAKQYKRLANAHYGNDKNTNSHAFLMNGGISIRTTAPNKNNVKQSFLAGNMGQGARGMFALNVSGKNIGTGDDVGIETNVSSWPKTVPLFETSKGENNQLGYTVSTPQIGRVSVDRNDESLMLQQHVRYATFLANGYNSPSKIEAALYIHDALGADAGLAGNSSLNDQYRSGDLIRKLIAPDSHLGLSTPLLVDSNFDGIVDVVYAGSYDGNLYRFDLRAKDPSLWSVHLVYKGDPNQPITAAPAISRIEKENGKKIADKYIVTFGTGTDLYQQDLTSVKGQRIVGIYDDINKNDTVVGTTDLLEQTFTTKKIGSESFRYLSNHQLSEQHKGWFINLGFSNSSTNDGERVTTAPGMFLETVVFNTRIYDNEDNTDNGNNDNTNDVCVSTTQTIKSDSQSWVIAINTKNGGGLTKKDSRIEFTVNNQLVQLNDYFANGQKYTGLSNFTIIQQNNEKSYTPDGSMRSVGEDEKLGQLKPLSNSCTKDTNSKIIVNDTTGGMSIKNIVGPKCQENNILKRLSWKEIH